MESYLVASARFAGELRSEEALWREVLQLARDLLASVQGPAAPVGGCARSLNPNTTEHNRAPVPIIPIDNHPAVCPPPSATPWARRRRTPRIAAHVRRQPQTAATFDITDVSGTSLTEYPVGCAEWWTRDHTMALKRIGGSEADWIATLVASDERFDDGPSPI